MDEIALYYPYFHVRDDAWLKAAALYLPQVARVPQRDEQFAVVEGALRGEDVDVRAEHRERHQRRVS